MRAGSPRPGDRFGPWVIAAEVGRGGTARVFRAHHVEHEGLSAAVKVIKEGMASPEILELWAFERSVLASLDVPGVARLVGSGESDIWGPWIATEWVDGEAVDRVLEREGATLEERLALLVALCTSLHSTHQQGVVHGDLRPENVLVAGEGFRCTVVDFGLAVAGSEVDVRRDVGGLGEIAELVLPIERQPRGYRADLEAVLARATAADLDDRYPTAHALGEEFRRILEGEAVLARLDEPRYRLTMGMRRHRGALAASGLVAATLVLAVFASTAAWRNATRARAQAEARRADLLLLSDITTLDRLDADVRTLPPPSPAARDVYQAWVDEAERVLERADSAKPRAGASRTAAPAVAAGAAGPPTVAAPTAAFESASGTARWRREQEERLSAQLERFSVEDPLRSPLAYVTGRVERIEAVDSLARTREVGAAWERLRSSIEADPRFDGWVPLPDPALVPLGRHPETGLWHFWHVPSGVRPAPAEDGGWGGARPSDGGEAGAGQQEEGLVFILLPGGSATIGAQSEDPASPRWDPAADRDEGPVEEVVLDPFYVAAHEMTRGQWRRSLGYDPTEGGEVVALDLPVTGVSWREATEGLARLGMALPSEAQWEYAARAGTDTPWFTGASATSLLGRANHRPEVEGYARAVRPPGSFGANGFGLHDTLGNVWEWTSGVYGFYGEGTSTQPGAGFDPGSGDLVVLDLGRRTIRGGGANTTPVLLRVSNRSAGTLAEQPEGVGVRPVRPAAGG